MSDIQKGEYVLATKWSDGDPQDHWCVGSLDHVEGVEEKRIRYFVVDSDGEQFRANGFRRIARIDAEFGKYLIERSRETDLSGCSLWERLDKWNARRPRKRSTVGIGGIQPATRAKLDARRRAHGWTWDEYLDIICSLEASDES